MGLFESKIKANVDMSLNKAFGVGLDGALPTGIGEEKAMELWKKYDENGDGSLDMNEARHMVIDLANMTVAWAKQNIEKVMEEVTQDGEVFDVDKKKKGYEKVIEQAFKVIEDEDIINQILKDFDTDGDGTVSREEFIAKATEGYSILQPAKKARTLARRVHSELKIDGKNSPVYHEIVGSSVYVSIGGYYPDPQPPFSLAAIAPSKLVNVSGQVGRKPGNTKEVVSGGVGAETTQCLENIKLILKACGITMDHLLKVTVYLKDNDANVEPGGRYFEMNKAYREFFSSTDPHKLPARSCVGCGALARGAQVEIECQAFL